MATKLINNTYYGTNEEPFSYRYKPSPSLSTYPMDTHLHNSYEILFFLEGDANYYIDGKIYHLSKNDLLLIKPFIYHNITLLSAHPYERIVLSFYENDLPEEIAASLREMSSLYHVPIGHPAAQILEVMHTSFNIFPEETFKSTFIPSLTLLLLHLQHIKNPHLVATNNLSLSVFENILSYIDKNPDKPLTIASLSKRFFLSESRISHLFKEKLKTTPMDYIIRKKISYAHSLLTSGVSPTVVAKQCSFKSYSTFYRHYKMHFGCGPKNNVK